MPDQALTITNPLVTRVLLAHRVMLVLTILLQTAYLAVRSIPVTAPRFIFCLFILAILSVLTVRWPSETPRHWRFCFSLTELLLVAVACGLGTYRWVWPLYLLVIARAALLVERKDVTKLLIVACCVQAGSYFVRAIMSLPVDSWSHAFGSVAISTLMMETGPCLLVVVVAWLMCSLLNEQNLRCETVRLASENEALARELERGRIAREIHDTLGHSLTALKIQLELAGRLIEIGDERAGAVVSLAENLAGRSLTDTRVALQSIRNGNFDFGPALDELLQEVKNSGALQLHVDVHAPTMSNTISYQIYRVIQECLTNTLKHARATDVYVSLDSSAGAVALEIRDNGGGFDVARCADGYGLKGMKERIASLHGNVVIQSSLHLGTTVHVEVPLS